MSFKIKGKSLRDKYHNKVVQDPSGNFYRLEFQGDGNYIVTDKYNKVTNGNLAYALLDDNVIRGVWKIYDQMPIFKS